MRTRVHQEWETIGGFMGISSVVPFEYDYDYELYLSDLVKFGEILTYS